MSRFATTQWSVILRGHGGPEHARLALESICVHYRRPVLGYIREHGYSTADAEDLTQEFFARLLEQRWDTRADPDRGRFRSFLLTVLRNFLANEWEGRSARKRGGNLQRIEFDEATLDAPGASSPEQVFNQLWMLTVIDRARRKLEDEARAAERLPMFRALSGFLAEAPDAHDYATVATALDMKPNTVAVHVHRLRHRLRELIREELLETVSDAPSLDVELQALRDVAGMAHDG